MIGPGQMEKFSENEIVERLDFSLEALEPDELILSIHEDYGDLARKIVEHCGGKNVNVSLWTMVFADRAASLSRLPLVRDFKGREGYGAIAAWNGMGKGMRNFSFAVRRQCWMMTKAYSGPSKPPKKSAPRECSWIESVILCRPMAWNTWVLVPAPPVQKLFIAITAWIGRIW
jgi:hypothetical protein